MNTATNKKFTATWASLTTPERARNWKPFVADMMVFLTRRKAQRDLLNGYQVVAVEGGYLIKINGNTSYAPMTAEVLYGWAERLPLVDVLRQADNYRADILT